MNTTTDEFLATEDADLEQVRSEDIDAVVKMVFTFTYILLLSIFKFEFEFNHDTHKILQLRPNQVNKNAPPKNRYFRKCPKRCELNQTNVYITFFGVFVGLTFGIIAFILAYTLGLKLKYKEIHESMKQTNSISKS